MPKNKLQLTNSNGDNFEIDLEINKNISLFQNVEKDYYMFDYTDLSMSNYRQHLNRENFKKLMNFLTNYLNTND